MSFSIESKSKNNGNLNIKIGNDKIGINVKAISDSYNDKDAMLMIYKMEGIDGKIEKTPSLVLDANLKDVTSVFSPKKQTRLSINHRKPR